MGERCVCKTLCRTGMMQSGTNQVADTDPGDMAMKDHELIKSFNIHLLSNVYHTHNHSEHKINCLKFPHFLHICAIFTCDDAFHENDRRYVRRNEKLRQVTT
jgi:hypothetical protein